jgi:hypothetical protein
MSSYSPGDWKEVYEDVMSKLGPGLSKAEAKYLRVTFMKAEDQMMNYRKKKKSVSARLRDPLYSRRGSFH